MEGIADNQLETWKKNFQQANRLRAQAQDQNNGDYKLANKEGNSSDEVVVNEGKPLINTDLKLKFHRSCIEGLWARTRHPNLWYELEFWIGFAIIGIGDGNSWIRIFPFIGPICLWAVMYFLTIPLTEKTMKPNRADYWDEYCKKYNMLLPNRWP